MTSNIKEKLDLIVPLNRKVVVEPEVAEDISRGGIIIPQTAKDKAPTKGVVLAIAKDSPMLRAETSSAPSSSLPKTDYIVVGDVILFSKYSGVEISIPAKDGEQTHRKIMIMKDEDILAVLRKQ